VALLIFIIFNSNLRRFYSLPFTLLFGVQCNSDLGYRSSNRVGWEKTAVPLDKGDLYVGLCRKWVACYEIFVFLVQRVYRHYAVHATELKPSRGE